MALDECEKAERERVLLFLLSLLIVCSFVSLVLGAEDCTNNIDDDADGFADCRDSECYFPTPQDCAGSTVSGKAQGIGTTHCTDGSPFYSSGQSRCCTTNKYWDGASCAFPPEDCSNGVSDDGDASIDVADSDCLLDYPYTSSDLELWNCTGTFQDYEYCFNAGSPRIECFDYYGSWSYRHCSISEKNFGASCSLAENLIWNGTHYECVPSVEDCGNGVDDDNDGLVDCADDECRVTSTITPLELGYYDCANNGQEEHGPGGQGYYCSQDKDLSETYLCCQNGYEAINNAGLWTCTIKNPGEELCSDGIDNDEDGLVDCADDKCMVLTTIPEEDINDYNCLNTHQTSDFCYENPEECQYTGSTPPPNYVMYCSGHSRYYEDYTVEYGINICCPVGKALVHVPGDPILLIPGYWECQDTQPCYPAPPNECQWDYNIPGNFLSWLNEPDCVDSTSIPATACCPVIQYGNFQYYSNSGNVKVY